MELVRKLQELIKEVQKYVDEQAKAHKKVRRRRGQAVGTRYCGNLIASPACVTWDFLWTAVRPFKESLHLLFSTTRCFGLAFSSLKWKNLTSLPWCQPSKKGSLIVDFILRNMHGVILQSAFFDTSLYLLLLLNHTLSSYLMHAASEDKVTLELGITGAVLVHIAKQKGCHTFSPSLPYTPGSSLLCGPGLTCRYSVYCS